MEMAGFQKEKETVLAYFAALEDANAEACASVESRFAGPDYHWRGYYPFGEAHDPITVGETFWKSLKHSLTRLQRRQDIFFAGKNILDDQGGIWVASMGHLMGLFDRAWLGIEPTQKMVMLRYCAFHKVVDGKLADVFMYFDIPHLMRQAGQGPFPTQTAAHFVQPGPITHGGLLMGPQPEHEGRETLDVIHKMIADLGQWKSGLSLEKELASTWHDDLIWWGPEGIGASYTIDRYAKQHSGPFRAAFSDRSTTTHKCRMAEGEYGGFVGWPNFTAHLTQPFMGMEPTGKLSEFRVIDLYRRDGDKLAENWVFIDLLHFWKQQGFDFLPMRVPTQ